MRYQVIVSNIGTVFDGENAGMADRIYRDYVYRVQQPHGRASGESVTLMRDDEIFAEYPATVPQD